MILRKIYPNKKTGEWIAGIVSDAFAMFLSNFLTNRMEEIYISIQDLVFKEKQVDNNNTNESDKRNL